jgi:hypothetical protein
MAIFAVVAVSAFGFAAANTVPASNAGDGSGAINGYTVSAISYSLDGTNPSLLDSVDFTLAPTTATSVEVQINGNWYSCTAGANPSCNIGGAETVLSAVSLRVVAAD